jgi:hypothetical protein
MYYEYEDGKSDYLGQSTGQNWKNEKGFLYRLQTALSFSILLTDSFEKSRIIY